MNTLFDLNNIQHLLCIGAHCDDIEIGCGGLITRLIEQNPSIDITFLVLSGANTNRELEAQASAKRLLEKATSWHIEVLDFSDTLLLTERAQIKTVLAQLKDRIPADLILTHYLHDNHQDHKIVSELTYNTWRNHSIFEYEILKFDGDIGNPNVYISLNSKQVAHKANIIYDSFVSQRNKSWFKKETVEALMRVRGVECNSEFAEAFYARKLKW